MEGNENKLLIQRVLGTQASMPLYRSIWHNTEISGLAPSIFTAQHTIHCRKLLVACDFMNSYARQLHALLTQLVFCRL